MRKILIISVLFMVLSSSIVLGIRGTSDKLNRGLNVEVGKSYEFYYTVINNQPVPHNYSIGFGDRGGGRTDLAKYFTAEPKSVPVLQPGESYTFKVMVNFYEESESYGQHQIKLSVTEANPNGGGGLQVTGSLGFLFNLGVLYPGTYINAALHARDIGENETEITSLSITNNGKARINDAVANVKYYNTNNKLIYSQDTRRISLDSFQSHTWEIKFPMQGYPPGKYHVTADLHYNGENKKLNDSYLVGTRQLEILNHTKELEKDKINKFDVEVESKWDGVMRNVWGEVTFNGTTVKTAPITLKPFAKGNLSTFLDANGVQVGLQPIKIRVYYVDRISEKDSFVAVIEKVREGPLFMQYFSITNLLLIILVIIMLISLALRIRERMENKHRRYETDELDDVFEGEAPEPPKGKKRKKKSVQKKLV